MLSQKLISKLFCLAVQLHVLKSASAESAGRWRVPDTFLRVAFSGISALNQMICASASIFPFIFDASSFQGFLSRQVQVFLCRDRLPVALFDGMELVWAYPATEVSAVGS